MIALSVLLLGNDAWLFTHILRGLIGWADAFLLYHLHECSFCSIQRALVVAVDTFGAVREAFALAQGAGVEDDCWWVDNIGVRSCGFIAIWSQLIK